MVSWIITGPNHYIHELDGWQDRSLSAYDACNHMHKPTTAFGDKLHASFNDHAPHFPNRNVSNSTVVNSVSNSLKTMTEAWGNNAHTLFLHNLELLYPFVRSQCQNTAWLVWNIPYSQLSQTHNVRPPEEIKLLKFHIRGCLFCIVILAQFPCKETGAATVLSS